MGYSQEQGYIANSIREIMTELMTGINAEFQTSYTVESFQGTGFYKYFYTLAQSVQKNEVKLAEVFLKLQDYFKITNETLVNPLVTPTGMIRSLGDNGFIASVKPMEVGDAGKSHICVDVDSNDDDYASIKQNILNLIERFTVGGVVTVGGESGTVVLENGQEFTFSYYLPSKTEVLLKLTITVSRNNQSYIETAEESRLKLFNNIQLQYGLGRDFEPERYFTYYDAPWASDILLEYSIDDGGNWSNSVFSADFDDLFDILLENIVVVES